MESNTVRIPWRNFGNLAPAWNELCADVLEVFGLPGDRFTSHPGIEFMDFKFKNKKDADLCRILLSDRI